MPCIVVADDDVRQLDLSCRLLEASGHRVLPAFRPSEALRQLPAADLVIMDLRFPNIDGENDAAVGLALIRDIRESGSHVPVIVVSGWAADLEGRPEEQLVSCVLLKPVGMAALLQAVGALVSSASAPSQNPPSVS